MRIYMQHVSLQMYCRMQCTCTAEAEHQGLDSAEEARAAGGDVGKRRHTSQDCRHDGSFETAACHEP